MINLSDLGRLVHVAVTHDPPKAIAEHCGDYYQPYYFLLYLLALHTPHCCVELGVEKGRGSFAMALAGRTVYGLDHTRRPEIAAVQKRFKNFVFMERPSLPRAEEIPGPIGVLHIDTEHSFAMAREEWWAYKDAFVPGSVACFDDTHAMENDVGRFVLTLPWPAIFDDRLHSCGYAVVLYDGER